MNLIQGSEYRRRELHQHFGGQRQGGISTPSSHSVILLFSSDAGVSYGYKDEWTEDGTFRYTGEGQVGDMKFIRGNLAIRDHKTSGKSLYLFTYTRKAHVRFDGEMRYVDHEEFFTQDRDGAIRTGIRFRLERVSDQTFGGSSSTDSKPNHKKPTKTERMGLVTSRVGQGYYRQELLEKFDSQCAVTGANIPEILIASHIVPWRESTDEEKLDPENGMLLSPIYDALFDKYLISFGSDGRIHLSNLLSAELVESLGIDANAQIEVTERMESYLERHRAKIR
ncbi:HNH endonuclease [Akkermansiaceae bacterium]|nr:HNH endonuclease [Akkermansiaceae bacterium]